MMSVFNASGLRIWIGCFLAFLASCDTSNQVSIQKNDINTGQDSIFFTEKNYSEIVLDSNRLIDFISNEPKYRSIDWSLREFYQNRSYQYAWITDGKLSPTAPIFYNQIQNYIHDFEDSSIYDKKLETLLFDALDIEDSETKNANQMLDLELHLSAAFLLYAEKEYTGRIKNPKQLAWYIPRKKKNLIRLLDSMVAGSQESIFQETVNPNYQKLKRELRKYRRLMKSEIWPVVNPLRHKIPIYSSDTSLIGIKKTLRLLGDFPSSDTSMVFTPESKTAITHFQLRMGLAQSGWPDKPTVQCLQIPISQRIRQIMCNLERLRWMPENMETNYLLVNIPEFKLRVIENGQVLWTSNLVVGKEAGRTQIFRGKISQVILNPSWGVPPGIARNEVLPGIKKNINYLARHKMEVFEGNKKVNPYKINWRIYHKKTPFTIRQKPGEDNPLGEFKFYLSNNYRIYLHNSNEKYLFLEAKRAFSHGCVRVEKARQLAEYLLRNQKGWTPIKLNQLLKNTHDYGIAVKPEVPVYIVYLTAWIDENGELNFRDDIYKHDMNLGKAIFGD